jgi:hypothetical protein
MERRAVSGNGDASAEHDAGEMDERDRVAHRAVVVVEVRPRCDETRGHGYFQISIMP